MYFNSDLSSEFILILNRYSILSEARKIFKGGGTAWGGTTTPPQGCNVQCENFKLSDDFHIILYNNIQNFIVYDIIIYRLRIKNKVVLIIIMKKQIGITLDERTLKALEEGASKLGLSKSQYIALLINQNR